MNAVLGPQPDPVADVLMLAERIRITVDELDHLREGILAEIATDDGGDDDRA